MLTGSAAADFADAAKVAAAPRPFIGRTIVFQGAQCADTVRGHFRCLIGRGSRSIRIEASSLGPTTSDEIAEKLIGPCKGEDKLASASCRFTIEITVTSAVSAQAGAKFGEPWTHLFSNSIEMR
ncbi:hypothetical protein [Enterovirga rhinocerotis]|uniref:hypothetical protein n=1 Tax=Enterovirga rhinocerotis TaxID=1339210 RepID=UPI00105ECCBC|nr:hypothetical protein [Enterovirga rhinocerotis]